MKHTEQKNYSIGEAARICGVTEKQIRHWEEKGHIPQPQRVICGKRSYRQFGEKEFILIRRIKRYLDQGFTLPSAASKAVSDIDGKKEGIKNGE
jgi:DNA-binding transcriptional MerR regulator